MMSIRLSRLLPALLALGFVLGAGAALEAQITADDLNQFGWRWVGPVNFSGRISEFAVPPGQTTTYYVLAASGGVWKTEDAGTHFVILVMLVFGGNMKRTGLASVSIFPILIMITLVEKFVAVQIEKGNKTALILAFETLIISISGFYIASWKGLIEILLVHPWAILITVPINIVLGRWTGLRVSEYIRFKDIIKKL